MAKNMKTLNFKIAAILILIVAALTLFMRYDFVVDQNKKLKQEKIMLQNTINETERVANLTDTARVDANQKLEAAKDEIKKLDDCIASGDCKRVVRVKYCPLSETASTGGATEGFAELAPSVQRAATDFEIRLAEQEHQLALCLAYSRGVSEIPLIDERK